MFRGARKIADEWGDTGWYRIRTITLYCCGYYCGVAGIRILEFFHWLKGDLNGGMENLDEEINKRAE